MAISIKSPEQIEKMRIAGRLASSVLEMIGRICCSRSNHRKT